MPTVYSLFSVLIILEKGTFILSNLYGILYASCIFTVISFFSLEKFSSLVLLKIFWAFELTFFFFYSSSSFFPPSTLFLLFFE